MCTPDNAAADELADRIYTTALMDPRTANAIVIRLHSIKTEAEVIELRTRQENPDDQEDEDEDGDGEEELPLMGIAPMIFGAFMETQHHPHGVRDRRYVQQAVSLATWMLRIAGIITDPPHPAPSPKVTPCSSTTIGAWWRVSC